MKRRTEPSALAEYDALSALFLRFVVGTVFLAHSILLWPILMGSIAAPLGGETLRVLAVIEPIVAIMIWLGFLTRSTSAVLCLILVGAIYTKIVHLHLAFMVPGGWSSELVLLAVVCSFIARGPGRFSVDRWLGWEA